MKKFSTPSITTDRSAAGAQSTVATENPRPGKRALDFIRRFARSYHYEPRLAALGSLSVN